MKQWQTIEAEPGDFEHLKKTLGNGPATITGKALIDGEEKCVSYKLHDVKKTSMESKIELCVEYLGELITLGKPK